MLREEKILAEIKSYSLDNGFQVILAPNDVHPIVSMQLFIRVGSCWEQDNEAGYSHFLEHLVFKSTEKYPNNQLTAKAAFLGSNINAYTEFDSTCYYLTLSSEFTFEGLEVLSELVRFANFSALDFKAEKGVVLEELNQYQNDPEDFFVEQIPVMYFSESPFRKPIIGTRESINSATDKELRGFYRKHYTPVNSYLVVSGNIDLVKIELMVEQLFAGWKRQEGETINALNKQESAPAAVSGKQFQETVYPDRFSVNSLKKKISKPILAFALPELSDRNPDSHTLGIITRIFAVGKKSRLHKRLIVKEKLVEQIRVESFTGYHNGISVVMIMPLNVLYTEKIIAIFIEEFDRIRHLGFSIDEFQEVKTELLHSHRYTLEYAQYLGMSLGTEELMGSYRNYLEYPNLINSITEESMQEMVKEYYSFDKLGIYHLGGEFHLEEKILSQVKDLEQKRIKNGLLSSDYYETKLANGVTVILKKVTGRPTIGITAAFPVSQLNERIENRGTNLLTLVLLLYGNSKFSYNQMLEYCSRHGIQLDVSAHEEVSTVKIKCFAELMTTSLGLLAETLLNPTFPAEHFLNIQQTLISNLERIRDYPSYYASHLWKRQMFGRESNLGEKEGTKTGLKRLSRKKIVNWYHNYYSLADMTLSIVGDFDFEDTLYYCERIFKQQPREQQKQQQEVILNPGKKLVSKKYPNNQQVIIHIGGEASPSKETKNNIAFHLLAQIIGGEMNSRLFDELREKRGLAYSVGFEYFGLQERGFYASSALVEYDEWREALQAIKDIMADVRLHGVRPDELETAKNSLRGLRLRSEESVLVQASALASLKTLGYDYNHYLKREERLQAVTLDDLHQLAKRYFDPQDMFIHILK